MENFDDYFFKIPKIFVENRNKHLELSNLILDSINNLADLIRNEMVSDEVIELLKNFHSLRRKIFLTSFLINANEYQWAVAILRSLVESIETLLIFMAYPNELHQSLQSIIDGSFKNFEESQKNLRKRLSEKYWNNESIKDKFIRLQFFKDEFSSSWAHSNYIINRSFSHQDLHKEGDNSYTMSDNGIYDDEHYLILNLYLLKIIYLFFDIVLSVGKDTIFSQLIKYSFWKQILLDVANSMKILQSKYPQTKYPELFIL